MQESQLKHEILFLLHFLLIWNVCMEHSIINVKINEKIYFKLEKMTFEKKVLSPWAFFEKLFYTSEGGRPWTAQKFIFLYTFDKQHRKEMKLNEVKYKVLFEFPITISCSTRGPHAFLIPLLNNKLKLCGALLRYYS